MYLDGGGGAIIEESRMEPRGATRSHNRKPKIMVQFTKCTVQISVRFYLEIKMSVFLSHLIEISGVAKKILRFCVILDQFEEGCFNCVVAWVESEGEDRADCY